MGNRGLCLSVCLSLLSLRISEGEEGSHPEAEIGGGQIDRHFQKIGILFWMFPILVECPMRRGGTQPFNTARTMHSMLPPYLPTSQDIQTVSVNSLLRTQHIIVNKV